MIAGPKTFRGQGRLLRLIGDAQDLSQSGILFTASAALFQFMDTSAAYGFFSRRNCNRLRAAFPTRQDAGGF